jgi:Zn ribbon nucleic-acid-binding protein
MPTNASIREAGLTPSCPRCGSQEVWVGVRSIECVACGHVSARVAPDERSVGVVPPDAEPTR